MTLSEMSSDLNSLGVVQLPQFMPLDRLHQVLIQSVNESADYRTGRIQLRLWKLEESLKVLHERIMESRQEDQIFISAKNLFQQGGKGRQLYDLEISPDDLLVFELKSSPESEWLFLSDSEPIVRFCENCKSYQQIKKICECKQVLLSILTRQAFYCSEDCQKRDLVFHNVRCPKLNESNLKLSAMNRESRKGLVGIQNLGNTCFMSSGLQCLSNIKELTEYFIYNHFQAHLNRDNPIGAKGLLALAYANLMKKMWLGTRDTVSP